MGKKVEHLKMIETIIERMANNSQKAKTYAIAFVSLFGTLISINSEKVWLFILLIPIVAFWVMDAKYLQLERTYRKLYDVVRAKPETEIDFNMSISQVTTNANDHQLCFCNCLFSWSTLLFYLFMIGSITGLYFILT